jgi:beta-N-acetylhexosaminidase
MRYSLLALFGVACLLSSIYFDDFNKIDLSIKDKKQKDEILPAFLDYKSSWVDSVFNTLSLDEKIGQLFMIAAYSNKDSSHKKEITKLIADYKIGGLIFFQGGPIRQLNLTKHYQNISKIPLLISIDAEWGLAMRLDSTIKFPYQMTLGAIQNDKLIYEMGEEIANECKRMGIHINLAPVADINNNPSNPVINYRSFGEDRENVTNKSIMYMQGLQDNRVIANAKHFPGHGDTDSDSHKTLPIIHHSKDRLDSLELYPFKQLIDSGIQSIMLAHLYIPSLDSTPNQASSLSKQIVTNLLKENMNFSGLVFTDALNMRGVSAFYNPGELDVKALLAGNDMLIFSEDVPTAILKIKEAIDSKLINIKDINKSVKKILKAKAYLELNKIKDINSNNLIADLNNYKAQLLNKRLYKNALTLIKNNNNIIPINRLDTLKIASLSIGENSNIAFDESINRYCSYNSFTISSKPNDNDINKLLSKLDSFNLITVSINNMNQNPYLNFGLNESIDKLLLKLSSKKKVILNLFGNPYSLAKLKSLSLIDAILISYEENSITKNLSGELIFGGIKAKGKLAISINKKYKLGHGLSTNKTRLSYVYPEEIGIDNSKLNKIDTIVYEAISSKAIPGCQILAIKDGKVFYNRSFGFHTYDSTSKKVDNNDIYDLASITKIASSAAAIMKLEGDDIISIDSSLACYIPEITDTTDYSEVNIKQMLTHQAGFTPWIPFYLKTLSRGKPKYEIYSLKKSDYYNQRVANNLFIHSGYRDSIFKRIINTPIKEVKKYKYSDIGYYFINDIIRKYTNQTQDEFLYNNFYNPLGLKNIGYKPRDRWSIDRVPPTEDDKLFRRQIIQADVHDQGAAILGGVAGHAGLFSNANDLAVMMQMYLNGGFYGGDTLIDKNVLDKFTSSPYFESNDNRRGVAFDKPVRSGKGGPTCSLCASDKSFGHSGFTGTITWADPENGFIYVFLSNRTFPDAENRKIISLNIRTRIQRVFTDAIKTSSTDNL